MPTVDEAWTWFAVPVEKLRAGVITQPDQPWDERRDEFRSELSAVTGDPLAERLVTWLDELSDSDRTTLLDTDDLPGHVYSWLAEQLPDTEPDSGTQPAAAAQGSAAAEYDQSAWYAFLAEHGVRWDGTEPNWGAFRDWFRYYATDAGFGTPATQLLDYLQPMAATDRISALAVYGVIIPGTTTATTASVESVATAAGDAGVELRRRVEATIARVLAKHPELERIPEQRRIELAMAIVAREGSPA